MLSGKGRVSMVKGIDAKNLCDNPLEQHDKCTNFRENQIEPDSNISE